MGEYMSEGGECQLSRRENRGGWVSEGAEHFFVGAGVFDFEFLRDDLPVVAKVEIDSRDAGIAPEETDGGVGEDVGGGEGKELAADFLRAEGGSDGHAAEAVGGDGGIKRRMRRVDREAGDSGVRRGGLIEGGEVKGDGRGGVITWPDDAFDGMVGAQDGVAEMVYLVEGGEAEGE